MHEGSTVPSSLSIQVSVFATEQETEKEWMNPNEASPKTHTQDSRPSLFLLFLDVFIFLLTEGTTRGGGKSLGLVASV